MSKQHNILILGGAGYIGGYTARYLQQQGFKVSVIDNLSTGHRSNLAKNIPLYEGDIGDAEFLEQVIKIEKPKVIMHFAASISIEASTKNPLLFYHNNVAKTICLFTVMEKYKIDKFIFSSTAAVYGNSYNYPIKEHYSRQPDNVYGRTKLMIEDILQEISATSKINYTILRYFNAAGASPCGNYGEIRRSYSHLIPLAIQTALGEREKLYIFGDSYPTQDGTCIRDYIHVFDLARAHCLALHKLIHSQKNEVFNVGSGQGFSVKQIIGTVREVSGKNFDVEMREARQGDSSILIADITKISNELHWEPTFAINDIIRTAWQWHKKCSK